MGLPFDESAVRHCEYIGNVETPESLLGVKVIFNDHTSTILQGDEITDELLVMCRKKTPPTPA